MRILILVFAGVMTEEKDDDCDYIDGYDDIYEDFDDINCQNRC